MKRFIIIIFLLLFYFSINLTAQIRVYNETPTIEKNLPIKKTQLDSTKWYCYDEVAQLVDEVLLLNSNLKGLEKYRFISVQSCDNNRVYTVDMTTYLGQPMHVDSIKKESFFSWCVGKGFYKYSSLGISGNQYVLYLSDSTRQSICKYIYNVDECSNWPFLPVRIYNYLQKEYVGHRIYAYTSFYKDIKTGEVLSNVSGETGVWNCIGIAYSEHDGIPFFILNNGNNTVRLAVKDLDRGYTRLEKKKIYSEREWKNLVKKYGEQKSKDLVFKREIWVGMPEKLVFESWGYPNEINQDSYGIKQMCYGYNCVYIDMHSRIVTAFD